MLRRAWKTIISIWSELGEGCQTCKWKKANKQGHDFWRYGLWCWILILSVMDPPLYFDFWPLKDRLWLTLLCKCSNTTRTLPAGSYHNFNYRESMCLWIWKYPWCCMLIWILLLPEHLIFKKLDPILNLLSARTYSMLMKLKIGKKSASNWQWWNQVSFFHCKYFSWPDSQKFSQEGTLLVPISF